MTQFEFEQQLILAICASAEATTDKLLEYVHAIGDAQEARRPRPRPPVFGDNQWNLNNLQGWPA